LRFSCRAERRGGGVPVGKERRLGRRDHCLSFRKQARPMRSGVSGDRVAPACYLPDQGEYLPVPKGFQTIL
jgi:hypothetical protein